MQLHICYICSALYPIALSLARLKKLYPSRYSAISVLYEAMTLHYLQNSLVKEIEHGG